MTHEPESGFEPAVAAWFRRAYGPDNVETQAWLPEQRWYADVVVDTGWCELFVEVENDAGETEVWRVEFGSGNSLTRRGWRPADLPIGAHVTVHGLPARDGSKTIAGEVERYLRTGETDPHHAAWPGNGFMERASHARRDLREALVREVRLLAHGRAHEPLPKGDTAALTREKVEPMVQIGRASCRERVWVRV